MPRRPHAKALPKESQIPPKDNSPTRREAESALFRSQARSMIDINLLKELITSDPLKACQMLQTRGPLFISGAVKMGSKEDLSVLLDFCENGPEKYIFRKKDICSYFEIALKTRKTDIAITFIEKLIKNANDLYDFKNENKNTFLHFAIYYDNLSVLKRLIQVLENTGADINIDIPNFTGSTPWALSLSHKSLNVAKFLVKYVKNINPSNHDGVTLIVDTIINRDVDCLRFLLELFLARNERIDRKLKNGQSLLHTAALYGKIEAYGLLQTTLKAAGEETNPKTVEGTSILHVAVQHSQTEMVKFLLNNEEEIDAKTRQGGTPLHVACHLGKYTIVALLIEKLFKKGKTISPLYEDENHHNTTPFWRAVEGLFALERGINTLEVTSNDYFCTLELFLKHPDFLEDVDLSIPSGSLLYHSVKREHFNIVEQLLPRLICKWQRLWNLDPEKAIALWRDISLGCVFLNNSVLFRRAIKEFTVLDRPTQVNAFKQELIKTLEQAGTYNNHEIAKLALVFLLSVETAENISAWLQSLRNQSNNKVFKKFISLLDILFKKDQQKILDSLQERLKIHQSKIAPLPLRVMHGNERNFEALKRSLIQVHNFLKNYEEKMSILRDIDFLVPVTHIFENAFSPILERYHTAKQYFISEESRLQEETLRPWQNVLDTIEQNPVWREAEKYLFDCPLSLQAEKNFLQQKHEAAQQAYRTCRDNIEKYKEDKEDKISLARLSASFDLLEPCLQELEKTYTIFSEQVKKYNKNRADEKMEREIHHALQQMETQGQKIQNCLRKYKTSLHLAALHGLPQDLPSDEISTLEQALSLRQAAQASAMAGNTENRMAVHLQVCDATEFGATQQAIAAIEANIKSVHNNIKQKLTVPKENLKSEILSKTSEMEAIINKVLKNTEQYERMIQNKAFDCTEIPVLWTVFKNTSGRVSEFKKMVEAEKKTVTLKRFFVDSECWLFDLAQRSQTLENALSQYHAREANDVESTQALLAQISISDEPPPLLFREIRYHPSMLSGLTLACVQERTQLKTVLELLHDEENAAIDRASKTNALLLSLAILFEKMKKIGANSKEDRLLLQKALKIRNAIFHHASAITSSQENEALLYQLAARLTDNNLDQRKCEIVLDELSRLFPDIALKEIPLEINAAVQCIEEDLQYLQQHASRIQQSGPSVLNNFIFQLDFAYRIGRAHAILSDLIKINLPGNDLESFVKRMQASLSQILSMRPQAYHHHAKAIRHDGLEAVSEAVSQFCVNIGTDLSMEAEQALRPRAPGNN